VAMALFEPFQAAGLSEGVGRFGLAPGQGITGVARHTGPASDRGRRGAAHGWWSPAPGQYSGAADSGLRVVICD